jgi:hypothetical protein
MSIELLLKLSSPEDLHKLLKSLKYGSRIDYHGRNECRVIVFDGPENYRKTLLEAIKDYAKPIEESQ